MSGRCKGVEGYIVCSGGGGGDLVPGSLNSARAAVFRSLRGLDATATRGGKNGIAGGLYLTIYIHAYIIIIIMIFCIYTSMRDTVTSL